MNTLFNSKYIITSHPKSIFCNISLENLQKSIEITNQYLINLPSFFSTTDSFYEILNQRNLSGFLGEIFKKVICELDKHFVLNPHPDGRPDILYLQDPFVLKHFNEKCFDQITKLPLRSFLAPFQFDGIEVKASIGSLRGLAKDFPIGKSRINDISSINYWAHHRHACKLLGIYYDFCENNSGMPQIKALFFCELVEDDWNKVSLGKAENKKTSNTSLNKEGISKLKKSMILCSNEQKYINFFKKNNFLM